MSMLDDLSGIPKSHTLCAFQHILQSEGKERYDEVMAVIGADDSAPRKLQVFEKHGYNIGLGTIGRHVRGQCVQCR